MRRVRIGLLGCGVVGGGLVQLIERERQRIAARDSIDLHIARILVRDRARERPGIEPGLLTNEAIEVIDDCDLVVELIGGVHSAGAYVRRALRAGQDVVTANKALLADCGRTLFALARQSGARIGFEASVCGGVPIVRAIERGLAGDSIESLTGIVNGTCNFILTRMEQDGCDFAAALRMAQQRGFAEADPAFDLSGADAMQKMTILSELAFGPLHRFARMHGIADVTTGEIEQARSRRCVVRHVGSAHRVPGGVEVRVERRELPETHPLAAVRDENNAVIVRGRAVGEMTFGGKGAGSLPTAAAVLSDVIELAASDRRPVAERIPSSMNLT
ncbi:MAG TPA: homoserine dehydrogenase [Thermoanaerobaculia bacterium]|nr:homoserine dehydrogenase [Thermoanaerobaculia bacterium]